MSHTMVAVSKSSDIGRVQNLVQLGTIANMLLTSAWLPCIVAPDVAHSSLSKSTQQRQQSISQWGHQYGTKLYICNNTMANLNLFFSGCVKQVKINVTDCSAKQTW